MRELEDRQRARPPLPGIPAVMGGCTPVTLTQETVS